jgi:hypothetical protein
MRRSEWLVRAALVFCLLYGAVAVIDRGDEIFPFFAWDLFAKVPASHGRDFSVRLVEAQGLQGTVPVYYEDSHLQRGARQIQGYSALQQLGRSLIRGEARSAALRKHFEVTYLTGLRRVSYEVVERTYDIRKRVDCRHCFTKVEVLATFRMG